LLAIAAHPDDVELNLRRDADQEAGAVQTGILDLTAGEMGSRGTPETRAKEAAKAAKFLGVSWRGTLGRAGFRRTASGDSINSTGGVIRDLRRKR